MQEIRFDVKMVESCVTCEYSESNYNLNIFRCNKYNLNLSKLSDRFHKDCRLISNTK